MPLDKTKKFFYNFTLMYRIIFVWLITVGLHLNVSTLAEEHNEQGLMTGGKYLTRVLRNFTLAFKDTHNMFFLASLILIGIFMFSKHWKKTNDLESFVFYLLSLFYATFSLFGISFRKAGDLSLIFDSPENFLVCFWKVLAYSILLSKLFQLVYKYSENYFQSNDVFNNETKTASLLRTWLILSLLGLIYLIILFPGTASWDTITQFRYYYGNPTNNLYRTSNYLITENASTLNDHHPVFLTLIYGFFADLGVQLGSVNIGIYTLTIIQYLFSTYTVSKLLIVFNKIGLRKRVLKGFTVFYGLFPLFPIFAIYLVKNGVYAVALLWFCTLLLEFNFNKKVIDNWRWRIAFFISIAIQLLTIKYGFHVLLLTGIYLGVYYKKYRIKLAVLLVVPMIIFQLGYNRIFLNALNVVPGDPVESYSIFFQQTARYIKEYPEDVTPEQKDVLEELFYYDKIADEYQPELSDPIKGRYVYKYDTVEPSDLKDYQKVWFQMFLKHPGVYFEATLHNMYGYFDLNKGKGFSSNPLANGIAVLRIQENEDIFVSNGNEFKLESSKSNERVRMILGKLIVFLANVPVLSFLFKGNFYVFLTIFAVICLALKKRYDLIAVTLPLLLQILVCIASPVNDNQRYMYPLFFGGILCIMLVILAFSEKKEAVT